MAVSKRLRFEVLRRDNHACRYCGRTAPEVKLTVDHVIPETLGGTDDPGNLVAACADCNSGKSSVPADAAIVEDVAQDAVRWARAMRYAKETHQFTWWREENRLAGIRVTWDKWTWGGSEATFPLPHGWQSTVLAWFTAGLDEDDVGHAINVAMRAKGVAVENRWRYCCGVAWRMVRERQEMAQDVLGMPGAEQMLAEHYGDDD